MLKAMSITRNNYSDMPGSVTEGSPNSEHLKKVKPNSGDFKKTGRAGRSDWEKQIKSMKEHEWVWK